MECKTGCKIEKIEGMIRHTFRSAGAEGIVVGISGGIDSAVAAALCCGAVGADHVTGILLPSDVTSEEDISDGILLCEKLGMEQIRVSISPILKAFECTVPDFDRTPLLVGNLMARIRMATLYYHANRTGSIVCGTSNKSEYMLGYSTKFGDSAADIQPIIHLYKTEVYKLARELGIPKNIIAKKPSAGLYPGQSDEKEIGFTYGEIDTALISLEKNNQRAETETEEAILKKVKNSMHKRMPPPSLL